MCPSDKEGEGVFTVWFQNLLSKELDRSAGAQVLLYSEKL